MYKDKGDHAKYMRQWQQTHRREVVAAQKRRRAKRRLEIIALKDKCARCGYDECATALDFHHRNRQVGDRTVSVLLGFGWGMKRIMAEIAKCELLCSNCHRLRHCKSHEAEAMSRELSRRELEGRVQ